MLLSFGKYRHLSQCSDTNGIFTILAIDHRANLLAELENHSQSPVSDADFRAFKNTVARHLTPLSTAILTDPDHGFPGVLEGAIPGQIGLIAPLEVTDYTPHPSQRATHFIPGWDVQKLKRSACSGAKLLLYFHPDSANAQEKLDLVDRIVADCHREQIPFFLEPIVYSLDPSRSLTNPERRQISIETVKQLSNRGVDIMKVEFPLDVSLEPDENIWREALRELDAACTVPWTLLSAGVPFEIFLRQAAAACEMGASGVMVGRAVWAEATSLHGAAREHFLSTTGRERLSLLAETCRASAKSWMSRHTPPEMPQGWFA